MVSFVESVMFQSLYPGNHYVIPKRLSQDVVESFFSVQSSPVGGQII
jgi:hypothetical protein